MLRQLADDAGISMTQAFRTLVRVAYESREAHVAGHCPQCDDGDPGIGPGFAGPDP